MKSLTDDTGPTQMLPGTSTPIKFFEQIFDDAFFDGVVEATNMNAAAKSPPPADAPARGPYATSNTHWLPTTAKEMRAFFGINMAMGITDMPEYKDYWSADPLLRNDYIASIMPRIRYEKLCQYMHCSVPQREDRADKLAKVRPIITLCERQFKAHFHPSCNVSIDEAMIRYDGRLSWKQYIPKKPVKWGFKLWCLCDSATGYCVAFSVYTGASNDDNNGMGLGYRIVVQLMTCRQIGVSLQIITSRLSTSPKTYLTRTHICVVPLVPVDVTFPMVLHKTGFGEASQRSGSMTTVCFCASGTTSAMFI